uniref:Uncharacterized protein n=1 Tax=Arundo donax TaxID=35708 RepID=A0A0A8ZI87_ARUDO
MGLSQLAPSWTPHKSVNPDMIVTPILY